MKQLPEKIVLDKAVQGQRHYQGQVNLEQMVRLKDMLAENKGIVDFSIYFDRAIKLLGKARIVVKTALPLICTLSGKEFLFHVEIDSTVGFIDDLAFEEYLDDDVEASWVENGFVKPLELIEDELILAIPDAPFDEDNSTVVESEEVLEVAENNSNPFAVLKELK